MTVETMDYIEFAQRIIRAAGKRVAEADEWELAELVGLETNLREALQAAVDGQRARGKSWEGIAVGLGVTRSAAYQRFGPRSN